MNWFPCFSIKEFRNFLKKWSSPIIDVINVYVRGKRNNKGEKELLTTDGKSEFDQDVFTIGNNFIKKYKQFFETYNGG
jgi:hypothetical protein